MRSTIFDRPPSLALRAFFAAPRALYRLGLGRVLGHRFLELEHRGRRSGRVRRTVLEVISYHRESGESLVVAAWGPHSDWYRNVLTGNAVCVRTAGQRYVPEHRILPETEAREALARYEIENGLATRLIRGLFGLGPSEAFADLAVRMPVLGLRPPNVVAGRGATA